MAFMLCSKPSGSRLVTSCLRGSPAQAGIDPFERSEILSCLWVPPLARGFFLHSHHSSRM